MDALKRLAEETARKRKALDNKGLKVALLLGSRFRIAGAALLCSWWDWSVGALYLECTLFTG